MFISSRPRSFTLYDPPSISSKLPTIPLALASLHNEKHFQTRHSLAPTPTHNCHIVRRLFLAGIRH